MKIKSPAITGEEYPNGTGVFQTTFFSCPNSVGRRLAWPTPLPLGPRYWGHSPAKQMPARIPISRIPPSNFVPKHALSSPWCKSYCAQSSTWNQQVAARFCRVSDFHHGLLGTYHTFQYLVCESRYA